MGMCTVISTVIWILQQSTLSVTEIIISALAVLFTTHDQLICSCTVSALIHKTNMAHTQTVKTLEYSQWKLIYRCCQSLCERSKVAHVVQSVAVFFVDLKEEFLIHSVS